MNDGPLKSFGEELEELCNRWASKPQDDRLTYGEMIQALEFKKLDLFLEAKRVVGELSN